MRVLFVSHRLNLSGASIHNLSLGKQLTKLGHDVAIVSRDSAEGTPLGKEVFLNNGFSVYKTELPTNPASILFDIKKYKTKFLDIIEEFKPDIIHVQAPTLTPFCVLALRNKKIPVVSTYNIEEISRSKIFGARLVNTFAPSLMGSCALAISQEMKDVLISDLGFSSDRVQSFPNSVDLNKFRYPSAEERATARSKFGVRDSDFVVSIAAILDERKGHEYAINAVKKLRSKGLDVMLLCGGRDAGNKEHLENLIVELGLSERVKLLGNVNSQELYWASDLSLLPSLKEGFGLVIIEAMLSGVVVARTRTAGFKDQIVEGVNGFGIDTGSVDSITSLVKYVLQNKDNMADIKHRGYTHVVENFSVEKMADATLSIYKDYI
ncbi:glycosyltransferase family 4 protein [Vibrio diabolicus]|uniref:glycosyltransferase family 4 protein n=1 Tax=Vibrio diabolicus TaxID=50719 RepID=UPI003751BCE3